MGYRSEKETKMTTDKSKNTAVNALKKIKAVYANDKNSWGYIISSRALKRIEGRKK